MQLDVYLTVHSHIGYSRISIQLYPTTQTQIEIQWRHPGFGRKIWIFETLECWLLCFLLWWLPSQITVFWTSEVNKLINFPGQHFSMQVNGWKSRIEKHWFLNFPSKKSDIVYLNYQNLSYVVMHLSKVDNWVFHDRRFCQIIWQIFTQGRAKKIHQKLPPVGFETRSSGSSGQCLTNWAKSTFSCQPESSRPL